MKKKYKFVEKYEGTYTKEFTHEEFDQWVMEHFEIIEAYEQVDGKWVEI